ncbi:MAG TPA: UvrD-helicase domain-containing protein [Actinomycetota bacterium]|nr:UvrD-helicase domain-containing protein [Actinomycetota bacterium]
MASDYLSGLNPVQREAVTHPPGPVLVVAGAGSGKTRVLTHRIAHLISEGTSPFAIIAITFTNKAAGEMKERVAALVGSVAEKMWVSTFHSACVRILRREAPRLGLRSSFSIYDTADTARLLKLCYKELNVDEKRMPPRAVAAAISDAKNKLVDAGFYQDFASNPWERTVARLYVEYQRRLNECSAMDFDDLIFRTVEVFDKFPEALGHYQTRFEHVLVDEFQDTNHAQARLATLLAGKHRNIFVVGDADQGIYAFRGATIKNLLDFERDWPDTHVITLEQNYRSTETILNAANAVIENNAMRKPKSLWTESTGGDLITRYHAQNEHDEALWVAREVARIKDLGYALADMAVFYRTNAQSRVLEEMFSKEDIAYRVVGGVRFYERKEVKDLLAWLRASMNPSDAVSVARAAQAPRRGIGDTTLERLTAFAQSEGVPLGEAFDRAEEAPGLTKRAIGGVLEAARLFARIRSTAESGVPVAEVVETAWEITGYMDELKSERTFESLSRQENLRELAGVAQEFDEGPNAGEGLTGFLEQLALITDTDTVEGEETGVTLMTLHNAKGLEFPVVFMIGMEDGVFPHLRSLGDPDQLEEERRLCYVGITRARERLYLLNAWSRSLWGNLNYNPASRFLSEIPAELVNQANERKPSATSPASARPRGGDGRSLADPAAFTVGQEVEHAKWGRGTIVEIARSNVGVEATVNFPGTGEKRLDLSLAPLKPAS